MNEQTAFRLRQRRPLEALDSGLLLYRRFFLRLYSGFLPVYVPVFIALALIPEHLIWISFLALWWFKPIWDRLVLRMLGTVFFNPVVSRRSVGMISRKAMLRGLVSDLSWRRFSLWRHYILPVRFLEGIRGTRLRHRVGLIGKEEKGTAMALGFFMFLAELFLVYGMAIFLIHVQNFIPYFMRVQLDWSVPGVYRGMFIAYGLMMGLLEPATVCMGFALYINRRVELEGWDLDIAFRRRSRRISSRTLVFFLISLMVFIPDAAEAQDARVPKVEQTPLKELEFVLADDDFGGTKQRTALRWRESSSFNNDDSRSLNDFGQFNFSKTLAAVLRIAVIAAAAALSAGILWKNRNRFRWFRSLKKDRVEHKYPTDPIGTIPITNTLDLASELYGSGAQRKAWATLYGYLTDQICLHDEMAPGSDATEGDFLKVLRLDTGKNSWKSLHAVELEWIVNRWRQAAYAHREPGKGDFRRASNYLYALSGESA